MWIILLIIGIKMNLPTWYWVIFTIFSILKPIEDYIRYLFMKGFSKTTDRK